MGNSDLKFLTRLLFLLQNLNEFDKITFSENQSEEKVFKLYTVIREDTQ